VQEEVSTAPLEEPVETRRELPAPAEVETPSDETAPAANKELPASAGEETARELAGMSEYVHCRCGLGLQFVLPSQ
jgi:hypothetical protein